MERRGALTARERAGIERGIRCGLTYRVIAAMLVRSQSAIIREITRNGGRDRYRASAAQERHETLAARCRTGRPMAVTECRNCGRDLKPGKGEEGTAGRGLCPPCHTSLARSGDLVDVERITRPREDLLADYEILRSEGYTWQQCAERLGMTYEAFERAMLRARADGDPRARRINEADYPAAQQVPA